jgi:hypothetical protein
MGAIRSKDMIGNGRLYFEPELQTLGFPTQLEVTYGGGPDLDPPVLVDFDFTPRQVGVATQSQTVACELTVTDIGSGASPGQSPVFSRCVLSPPLGSMIGSQQCNLRLVSGDVFNGVWACNISIPQGTVPGLWTWNQIRVLDAAGNRLYYHEGSELEAAGFPSQLDVVSSNPDLDDPVLVDFDFTPRQVDVATQSQTVACELTVTDIGSGASPGQSPVFSRCVLSPPLGSMIGSQQCNLRLVSGDVFNGVWACNISIPQGTVPGLWTWNQIRVLDAAGNRLYYHEGSELEAAGFPSQLDVTYGP